MRSDKGTNVPKNFICLDYFRPRDFEYAQPLYDLAFSLHIDSIAKKKPIPEYRIFALLKSALGVDGYSSTIDKWLSGILPIEKIDYVPTNRIKNHLLEIMHSGTISELTDLASENYSKCKRLQKINGLGIDFISEIVHFKSLPTEWLSRAAKKSNLQPSEIISIWDGNDNGIWQIAHIIPPLLRILNSLGLSFCISNLSFDNPTNGLDPISGSIDIFYNSQDITDPLDLINSTLKNDVFFSLLHISDNRITIKHQMGWCFTLQPNINRSIIFHSVYDYALEFDTFFIENFSNILCDLHTHSSWSDGLTSLQNISDEAKENGLKYIAITDHSRSSRIQNGLVPTSWISQHKSISYIFDSIPILHGLEVDILKNGSLDFPYELLEKMDLVIGSVHDTWTNNISTNTERIIRSIKTGLIDIIGHPTSCLIGLPGMPTYIRNPVNINWDLVFQNCANYSVALEFNCFPSRNDLRYPLLIRAIKAGCWISFGSDAHNRTHLNNLFAAENIVKKLDYEKVLNKLTFSDFKMWISKSRKIRKLLKYDNSNFLDFDLTIKKEQKKKISISNNLKIPNGSKILGIDLTSSNQKLSGVALLDGFYIETFSLLTDDSIIDFINTTKPSIVSIDSPLGFPGGGNDIMPSAGILRKAESDLASIGIPSYPALIESMKNLTIRGIQLKRRIENLDYAPKVIESYPGAAQDILNIPRKQRGLNLLRNGLKELGIFGPGLNTLSHDEMDAITSSIVGRYFEVGEFVPMGIPTESELIVPKRSIFNCKNSYIICLAGKNGTGKSTIARYLSVNYGFYWIKTRDIVRSILFDDIIKDKEERIYQKVYNPNNITDEILNEFGIILLEKYKQKPVLDKLASIIAKTKGPIIVDSARDISDYTILSKNSSNTVLWYIESKDSEIEKRLSQRQKASIDNPIIPNSINKNSDNLRTFSDRIIENNQSLEKLRWSVDDILFSNLDLFL